jgi:hypothetical protein
MTRTITVYAETNIILTLSRMMLPSDSWTYP